MPIIIGAPCESLPKVVVFGIWAMSILFNIQTYLGSAIIYCRLEMCVCCKGLSLQGELLEAASAAFSKLPKIFAPQRDKDDKGNHSA